MANLKEIRSRISSVGSTMQITNAMKMVSAAKLKKAQDAVEKMGPYAEKLRELIANVSMNLEGEINNVYTEKREVKKILYIAISSNRGLAGAFNTNVIREVNHSSELQDKDAKIYLMTIGKKANDILKKNYSVYDNESHLWDNFNFETSSTLANKIMKAFENKEFDEVRLVYNHFKNAATQIIKNELLLPIVIEKNSDANQHSVDYIFEPNRDEILLDLIPKTIKTQLFKALLDSNASEHGARMTAMHKATDNAEELRRDLILQYNKARQATITNEILEIVGGADALDG
ncbi:F-ATPase gamma subunit [Candidatus Ornithobacterium hominis]|uniref:ATP synthase gamma chain n=1 Tax=Candidatus Ornithobacterium hominis TaxID=2497989 RepID=A0A383TUU3_9FLAO|nr:ATP synthase F1 subunit gamma [Candidatus Ornithobacterium hominis]MCT7903592.1 ATP synthase F1 subunit gamma [Candidatus Ornithobacterium hominis]SZD70929.1 F-ATPase gamma subunit [Candidatus Ornithobacterium hominis]